MQEGIFIKKSETMSSKLFEIMEIEFEESTEFDRQMLAIFSFGMISAYATEEKFDANIVSLASEFVLIKVFKYSKEQAKTFLELLIESTKKGVNPTYYRIIHEGIEMYYEYVDDDDIKMFDRMMKAYLLFKKQ